MKYVLKFTDTPDAPEHGRIGYLVHPNYSHPPGVAWEENLDEFSVMEFDTQAKAYRALSRYYDQWPRALPTFVGLEERRQRDGVGLRKATPEERDQAQYRADPDREEIQVDDDAMVSEANGGVWVQAWVWIPDE